MSELKQRIGKNIRDLRKAYGESQEGLGRALNVAHNTISMYESGEHQPDLQMIQAIANHYSVPADCLLRDDFSEINFKNMSLDWATVISLMEARFPIICTNGALKDEHFAKGLEYTHRIWNSVKKGNDAIFRSAFERAMDEYSKSDAEEAIANILWLIFVMYLLLPDEHAGKIGEAVLNKKATGLGFWKNYVLRDANPISKESAENKCAYANDMHLTIMECIKELKDSALYSDLGDYYWALKYILGLAANEYSDDFNEAMGLEMMLSLLTLGNKYAFCYFDKSYSI